jgi:hypothetical protein
MPDEDRETRTDEDVEGHQLKNQTKAHTKARNDEGDDVEGHQLKNQTKAHTKARNEEGDDVDAHMLKSAVEKGMTKL